MAVHWRHLKDDARREAVSQASQASIFAIQNILLAEIDPETSAGGEKMQRWIDPIKQCYALYLLNRDLPEDVFIKLAMNEPMMNHAIQQVVATFPDHLDIPRDVIWLSANLVDDALKDRQLLARHPALRVHCHEYQDTYREMESVMAAADPERWGGRG